MTLRLFVVLITFTIFPGFAIPQSAGGSHLIWADEFNGTLNSPPDPLKWTYDLGDGGWGNHEKERYTRATENAFQDGNGHLVIRALRDGDTFTSARIKTEGLFQFQYGRVEARIKIPSAHGLWPAFWLLGANIKTVGWPSCGEIDIMENFGPPHDDARTNRSTLHGPGYQSTGMTSIYRLPPGESFSDDFHVFAAAWKRREIDFSIDGISYFKATRSAMPAAGKWVFDNGPLFLLLNLAVGGSPAPVGYPDDSVRFPQEMLVDYIRVYQR
ncbi:MAG TPA: glycoside hydrolase family 16 protein [Bryobacteraceae bacterium]|nr:glycoside hydrolase family 16 protein [Bryobacteraceae bacterium]